MLALPQNICRSATLSTMAEMYGRAGMDWFTGTTFILQQEAFSVIFKLNSILFLLSFVLKNKHLSIIPNLCLWIFILFLVC